MALAPYPFTLRQLQYVVAVADGLSFRKAAARCRVSQPSLSAQLAQLEQAIGVRLFERDRKGVIVTPAGGSLIERARQLLLGADDFVDMARRAGDPLAGTLRIGVIPTISPYLLPNLTPRLRADFPQLTPAWIEDKTAVLVSSLEAGLLDAAILALEADIGDLAREIIAVDRFVLVAAPQHPLAKKSGRVATRELRDADVLLLDDGHCFREQALAVCSMAHELEFRATSLSTLVQMVAGGAGVTLLPELSVATETQRAALRVRRFEDPVPHRTIALVWRKQSPFGSAFTRLAKSIRDAYRKK
jgi:LysR family hydrogen peroxide-inducible transcriptional activator